MTENRVPEALWPPKRSHHLASQSNNATSTPSTPSPSRGVVTLHSISSTPETCCTPRTPLASVLNIKKPIQNGYEKTPRALSYTPYCLNERGSTKRKAISRGPEVFVIPANPICSDRWNYVAVQSGLIPSGGALRPMQLACANAVLERSGDIILISPTGSGKSLLWCLPLVARSLGVCEADAVGISLVITPYTSLGKQGESLAHGLGITSTFVHSEKRSYDALEAVAGVDGHVVYICAEMLESPSFAQVLFATRWVKRLSAIYIDEGHEVSESISYRPAYSRLSKLRKLIPGVPWIALSATLPSPHRLALVTYAGFSPNTPVINFGNFRAELSWIVLPIEHSLSSFRALAFVLPLGTASADEIEPTIIFCDDLERLTAMLWWFHHRIASLNLPEDIVEIIHAGLSNDHQTYAIESFRNGKVKILLGSAKIGPGMDFPHVTRVIQYMVRGLTLVRLSQRGGRGGRKKGSRSTCIILVEPSMISDSDAPTPSNPRDQDPALVDLIHSEGDCVDKVFDRGLENPPIPPESRNIPGRKCCNRCYPHLRPARDFQFIFEDVALATTPSITFSTDEQDVIFKTLVTWRRQIWTAEWKNSWPEYGPKSLINDIDLKTLVKHAGTISCMGDMEPYVHTVHWSELAQSLFEALSDACLFFGKSIGTVSRPDHTSATKKIVATPQSDSEPPTKRPRGRKPAAPKVSSEYGEQILRF
ncbi:ATP-dependent DNA helicase RecQ [Stygiomarasmius scandens]|uniref:DNA 3'-5' helicase n=1 Tax=Marasmiellus scandens TaxID=2682957 RepID=A0ABR1KCM9_9AGAR